ncbi:dipicolinate synthase subunit B [Lentibacillus cibarius]|uniref:Dipicolinate synthase subunit B n=2 Tax=Lentibacillus cibarius TaxID=2583219 RepID=A0A549YKQ5_9BACI|nr:dipicolinate synthase subunit B [Lentibacillus cibarius]TRM12447.1 dipicolinate synthase subunit B [Lentibacillus cibarius]
MMGLEGKRIGFGVTGSHCTYDQIFPQLENLMKAGAEVVPVISYTVQNTDSKFGYAADHVARIESITGKRAIRTIPEAEPLGPDFPLDCMVIAPLTGNSMSKLANALTDTPVLMAAKATIRNQKPVVLGIATNDALGMNGVNLMRLMASKYYYFIPYGQDNPNKKPNSLVSDMSQLSATIESALQHEQIQPVIIPH